MQTTIQHSTLVKSIAALISVFVMSFSGTTLAEDASEKLVMLEKTNKWQVARLFEPGENQRRLEEKGYITIYDNLPDTTVDKAMNNNFERIENMMFTRVVITDDNGLPELDEAGNIVIEDDGC
jgi:hypothetical protein